ncbi:MAG: transposase [Campylobacterales bacterium]
MHLVIEYPRRLALSKIVNFLKGISNKEKNIFYSKNSQEILGGRSYFIANVGGAPIKILKGYIENQKASD